MKEVTQCSKTREKGGKRGPGTEIESKADEGEADEEKAGNRKGEKAAIKDCFKEGREEGRKDGETEKRGAEVTLWYERDGEQDRDREGKKEH